MLNFLSLDYLRQGSPRQQLAYRDLTEELRLAGSISKNLVDDDHKEATRNNNSNSGVLDPFHPVLAGTVPLGIDIPGKSDLDIICQVPHDQFDAFESLLRNAYGALPNFSVRRGVIRNEQFLIAELHTTHYPIEIFAQAIPVTEQNAYRHMIIEHELLQMHGDAFREKVVALKKAGVKTEPAFCQALGLECDDPYDALLQLDVSSTIASP